LCTNFLCQLSETVSHLRVSWFLLRFLFPFLLALLSYSHGSTPTQLLHSHIYLKMPQIANSVLSQDSLVLVTVRSYFLQSSSSTNADGSPSLDLRQGANGYIGSHIVEQLLTFGFRVRGAVRSASKVSGLEKRWESKFPGKFEVVEVPDFAVNGAYDEAAKSALSLGTRSFHALTELMSIQASTLSLTSPHP